MVEVEFHPRLSGSGNYPLNHYISGIEHIIKFRIGAIFDFWNN
jgi:hypothetical protein